MNALYYPAFGKLEVNEQPVPSCHDDEVLINVAACGLCGSELETFAKRSDRRMPPLIMGHEFCGVIVKIGKDVSEFHLGQRVVSNSIISCGRCGYCALGKTNLCESRQVFGMHRNGAFAEYVNVPARSLLAMPDHLEFREACLAEPLANGVHMVALTKHLDVSNVLIVGAGPIGLTAQMAMQALRNVPVTVSDVNDERLEVAKRLGCANALNPSVTNVYEASLQLTNGEGFDLVIDAVGMEITSRQSLAVVRNGGALVLIGLHENSRPFFTYDIVLAQKQIIGTYAATREDMAIAVDLLANKKVDASSWVHYYSLDDSVHAFNDMLNPTGNRIKAVMLNENL